MAFRSELVLPCGVFAVLTNPYNSMKLDKSIVERRIDLMAAEGVVSFSDIA